MPANTGKRRKRELAIAALLANSTVEAAAKECGLGKRTLQRWLADGSFRAEYQATKVQLLRAATSKLTVNAMRAAETLETIFTDAKAAPGARVSAAVNNLRLALDAYEFESLEERIRRLEEQTDGS